MMHIDYAREVVEYHEDNYDEHNMTILKSMCAESEVMKIAESMGVEKVFSICKTMREATHSRYNKITDKQRHAVAAALLEKYGTARAVLALAFNKTELEMFGAEVEIEDVQIHPKLRIGFGLLSDFVADAKKQEEGVTYPASRSAIRATKRGDGGTMTVLINGHGLTAVTVSEAKKLNLPEQEAEWYQSRVTDQDIATVAGKVRL